MIFFDIWFFYSSTSLIHKRVPYGNGCRQSVSDIPSTFGISEIVYIIIYYNVNLWCCIYKDNRVKIEINSLFSVTELHCYIKLFYIRIPHKMCCTRGALWVCDISTRKVSVFRPVLSVEGRWNMRGKRIFEWRSVKIVVSKSSCRVHT